MSKIESSAGCHRPLGGFTRWSPGREKTDPSTTYTTTLGKVPETQETRVTDPTTGGQKGMKGERYGLIPVEALKQLARVYGVGAAKYSPYNWTKGYSWTLSYDALQRHLNAFWGGEELDPESGLPHLAHAAWHCFTLLEFCRIYRAGDDRWTSTGS